MVDDGILDRLLASPLFVVVGFGIGAVVVALIIRRGRLENEPPSMFEKILFWLGTAAIVGSALFAFFFGIPREVPPTFCDPPVVQKRDGGR